MRDYREDGSLIEKDFGERSESTPAEPYHIPMMIPQFLTERIMRDRLAEFEWPGGVRPATDRARAGRAKRHYGFGRRSAGPRLIKPHGSLNWHTQPTGRHLKRERSLSFSVRTERRSMRSRPTARRSHYGGITCRSSFRRYSTSFDEQVFRLCGRKQWQYSAPRPR
jgi:hypothetical protein